MFRSSKHIINLVIILAFAVFTAYYISDQKKDAKRELQHKAEMRFLKEAYEERELKSERRYDEIITTIVKRENEIQIQLREQDKKLKELQKANQTRVTQIKK
jgi:hypothetical protein